MDNSTTKHSFATSAVWEVAKRLSYHTQSGQMLAGLNYDKEGKFRVEGRDTLPMIQPWSFNVDEETFAGALNPSSQVMGSINSPLRQTISLSYRIGFDREYMFIRHDVDDETARKGALGWISLIKDAIETNEEGLADSGLNQSLSEPLKYFVTETETSQLAFYATLEVSLVLRPICRTLRSSDIVIQTP